MLSRRYNTLSIAHGEKPLTFIEFDFRIPSSRRTGVQENTLLREQDKAMTLVRSIADWWTVAVAVLFGSIAMQALAQEQAFSKDWMTDMLSAGESGSCSPLSNVYEWRNVGWGSNLNRESCIFLR